MIILNAVYQKPEDEKAFFDHYDNVHLPLTAKIPGLLKAEVERVSSVFMGEPDNYFMVARLYFENKDTFKTAMASSENRATGKDLQNFAKGKVSLYVSELMDT
jgi:uncharacterized protein (TIGR02118 family)